MASRRAVNPDESTSEPVCDLRCCAPRSTLLMSDAGTCLACRTRSIEYESTSCGHKLYCKPCAMKCATGGKCKVCGELFADLRRVFQLAKPASEATPEPTVAV